MSKFWQVVINVALYALLLWLLYDSAIRQWDPWFAGVVGFVLVLAAVISLVPGLRAKNVSPGSFPYDDDQ
jgi:hypothetical protein